MKPSRVVDLSVMWSNETKKPEKIRVFDCPIPNFQQHFEKVSGFYGFHAKGKGLQYCTLEAEERKHIFVPVTLSVHLECDISTHMVTPETLQDFDMLNVARASRALIDQMAAFWYSRLEEKGWTDAQLNAINFRLCEKFMPADESLVTELLKLPAFKHLNLFVYPALPLPGKPRGFLNTPISVGVANPKCIKHAFSPMYPDLEIELP